MTPELKALVAKVRAADESLSIFDFASYDAWTDARALAAIRCVAEATREASEGMQRQGWLAAHRVLTHDRCNHEMLTRAYATMHAASVLGEALRHE